VPRVSYIDGRSGRVDPMDRGLAYGDGLFETMVAENGMIRWLDYHFDRLLLGCGRLEIAPPDLDSLRRELDSHVPSTGRATVKLILTRGSGRRGYAPQADPGTTIIIMTSDASSAEPMHTPVAANVLELRLGTNEKLAGIKHLCRLEQVLAQLELQRCGFEEGVMLDTNGLVVGCTSANLFAVFGSELRTPKLLSAGVNGVMRRVVLETCARIGLMAEETEMDQRALLSADELFLTNAVVGLRSIRSIDGNELASMSLAQKLNKAIFGARHA
jgi:4-amino-4-deoxychorismate lyase